MRGIVGDLKEGGGKCTAVALGNEQAIASGLHGFRNSAMPGGHHRKTAGHGFEHRIGNAFLIAGLRCLAGMQEKMGRSVGCRELMLTEKTRVVNRLGDAETLSNFFEPVLERAFACQNEFGVRVFVPEVRESLQRNVQALSFR